MSVGPEDGTRPDDPEVLSTLLERQRHAFLRDGIPGIALRRDRIDRLMSVLFDNSDALCETLRLDFGHRPRNTTLLSDVLGISADVAHIRSALRKWMRPRSLQPLARLFGVHAIVEARPKGIIGIIGPWNFPLALVVQPAVAALAAGNRVMIKVSEVTPRTAELFKRKVEESFSPEELVVITGGSEAGEEFSRLPFDHLLFTGSADVGRNVMRAAAENLVPVTLELGGKNPAVVGRDADLHQSAHRIAGARMVNGGQTCLCPDYVFVLESRTQEFIDALCAAFLRHHPVILDSEDHCTIVSNYHYQRLMSLLDDARRKGAHIREAGPPGEQLPHENQRRMAPTVLANVTDDMNITRQEIFGPLITVHPYRQISEVISYVNGRPSPLAAYWFGGNSDDYEKFRSNVRSGGIARNDFALHAAIKDAPFGGIGQSGMGAYHGRNGFDAFTHRRTVASSRLPWSVSSLYSHQKPSILTHLSEYVLAHQRRVFARRRARNAHCS
ncbi:aldehyde dehydrogenase family protein [Streptomyces sp. NPDC056069]|uniref:aldehyde dehydrogenase family protein n=1 Tax=Streptomyces sp. NPDC056069 TaxID=3345702 RepID=UPI0035D7E88C